MNIIKKPFPKQYLSLDTLFTTTTRLMSNVIFGVRRDDHDSLNHKNIKQLKDHLQISSDIKKIADYAQVINFKLKNLTTITLQTKKLQAEYLRILKVYNEILDEINNSETFSDDKNEKIPRTLEHFFLTTVKNRPSK